MSRPKTLALALFLTAGWLLVIPMAILVYILDSHVDELKRNADFYQRRFIALTITKPVNPDLVCYKWWFGGETTHAQAKARLCQGAKN